MEGKELGEEVAVEVKSEEPNEPLRSSFSKSCSVICSFFAANSSTSQFADMYLPLKNSAWGEARYTAVPAASSAKIVSV